MELQHAEIEMNNEIEIITKEKSYLINFEFKQKISYDLEKKTLKETEMEIKETVYEQKQI